VRALRRLLFAFCAVFLVVLTAGEYLTVQQEMTQLRHAAKDNLRHLAHVLQATTRHRWEQAGRDAALETLAAHELPGSGPKIRWLPEAGAARDSDGDFIRFSVPLQVDGVERGFIELSQSSEYLERYAHRRIVQLALLESLLLLATFGLIYGLGTRIFGERLGRLAEQARRIGAGDLDTRVDSSGNDEISVLGRQMNAMSDQLLAGRIAIEAAEAERLQTLAQLRHTDCLASIGRLSSVLAHELGTPLNVVLGRARLIAEHPEQGTEVVKNAEIVHAQAQRMTESIRATLGLARRGSALQRLDMHETARDALSLLEPLARRKGVRISLAPPPGPTPIRARQGEIEQIVMNLVGNALDAVDKGGSIDVEISNASAPPERHRGGLFQRLCVSDDGCGIPEADLPHIFEPFHSTKAEGKGTGLGLWIVDGIVRDHGGWIEVESRLGAGTRFDVYLPAAEDE